MWRGRVSWGDGCWVVGVGLVEFSGKGRVGVVLWRHETSVLVAWWGACGVVGCLWRAVSVGLSAGLSDALQSRASWCCDLVTGHGV